MLNLTKKLNLVLSNQRHFNEIRNEELPYYTNDQIQSLKRYLSQLSKDQTTRHDQWFPLDILMLYTNIFIMSKSSMPDLPMVTRELDTIHAYLLDGNLPQHKFRYVKYSLWLAAKWGYDDKTYLYKCIQILSNEMMNGHEPSAEDLASVLWSYATLLEISQKSKIKFMDLWYENFERAYANIPMDGHLWNQLIPALEYFMIPLPNGDSIGPYYEMFLRSLDPEQASPFEKEVASNLEELKIKFYQGARISIYTPDFVIEHAGKRLVLECDGVIFHPFPNRLRDKIFRLHGYSVVHVTNYEYTKLTHEEKLIFLDSLIKQLAQD